MSRKKNKKRKKERKKTLSSSETFDINKKKKGRCFPRAPPPAYCSAMSFFSFLHEQVPVVVKKSSGSVILPSEYCCHINWCPEILVRLTQKFELMWFFLSTNYDYSRWLGVQPKVALC
eukprot:TRINITY_DN3742_c0_g4_i1.p2 TRINITY_DN3742_c0_g4~~TRINITY_DN3742_c0_g4_i1.p2  ORF type:complete len:118 (+),score=5.37 TRINITY_DN3742_c0_g4_i1:111-464(+)